MRIIIVADLCRNCIPLIPNDPTHEHGDPSNHTTICNVAFRHFDPPDILIHQSFDETKHHILKSACLETEVFLDACLFSSYVLVNLVQCPFPGYK